MAPLSETLANKVSQLHDQLTSLCSCVVALSGGVDSAVLAAAAYQSLGGRALAVTAASESLSEFEKSSVLKNVAEIGIAHRFVTTREMDSAGYRANAGNRCFFCKQTLYQTLQQIAKEVGFAAVVCGVNDDDLDDHRPGIIAARDLQVVMPLADCKITKADIRELAQQWQLTVWDRPSNPCLASRIAYGVEVTADRLQQIEQAEAALRGEGFSELRVRIHAGDLARIEVALAQLPLLLEPGVRERITGQLKSLGFKFVTFDLEGLKSGSLNALIPVESLSVARQD